MTWIRVSLIFFKNIRFDKPFFILRKGILLNIRLVDSLCKDGNSHFRKNGTISQSSCNSNTPLNREPKLKVINPSKFFINYTAFFRIYKF